MTRKALRFAGNLFAPLLIVLLCSNSSAISKPDSSEEVAVRNLIYSTREDVFAKSYADNNEIKPPRAQAGKRFLDFYPLDTIEGIESIGDGVRLPNKIVADLLALGTFTRDHPAPLAVHNGSAFRVRLKNKSCILFRLVFDPRDQSFSYAESPIGVLVLPKDLRCGYDSPHVKKGMTRAELAKLVHADGGMSAPFNYERKVLNTQAERADGNVIKLNFAMKPANVSEEEYARDHGLSWTRPSKESDTDVVVRFSPPYLERPFTKDDQYP